MGADTLVVRNTFLEVFEQEAEVSGGRRQHSAPPTLEARRGSGIWNDPFAPRLATSSVVYDSPANKRNSWQPTREAWEPPSGGEEWLPPAADADIEAPEEGLNGRDISTMTTVILRNVPHSYTRDDLLDLLDSQGFYGRYDFLYLPVKFGSSCAFGYALINLVEHEDARRFQAHFLNFTNWNAPCSNVASVSWSKAHQGLAEHVERYRNSPMMHPSMPDDCKPIILRNGARAAFPPPTKKAAPQRRVDKTRNSRRRESGGTKAAPGSVSSLNSEMSYTSDNWKAAASASSTASTPAATPGNSSKQLAEPTASPLFQGLTWLGGSEEPPAPARSEVGLYQLTTQMICGSDCSSEHSLRSSAPSQLTSGCRSAAPSTCSSKGRRVHGVPKNSGRAAQLGGQSSLLAAGLEAVPDAGEPLCQEQQEDVRRRQWWNPFGSGGGGWTAPAPATAPAASYREPAAPFPPLLPGSIVELGRSSGNGAGQQGRILVVDHARDQYKVQLSDGHVHMVRARHVRPAK